MKKLLLIALMIIPIIGMSKGTIFTEWQTYLDDCNEIVPDTVRQTGVVNCELIPVKMNGKIISYNQNPKDTVWNSSDCKDYKYPISVTSGWISGSGITFTNTSVGIGYVYTESEPAKNYFTIKRNNICQIKKRKASFEDFFERWCVEKKLIKFN